LACLQGKRVGFAARAGPARVRQRPSTNASPGGFRSPAVPPERRSAEQVVPIRRRAVTASVTCRATRPTRRRAPTTGQTSAR
jgi:hypothetical protein